MGASHAGGYPIGITAASEGLFRAAWRGGPPPITVGDEPSYWPSYGVRIGRQAGALDPLAVARHELEHARQMPPGAGNRALDDRLGHPTGPALSAALEVPAAIGDLAYVAEAYRRQMGRPLAIPVEVAPGVVHDAGWMAGRAREHGFFAGRSMTGVLATPSGLAYLGRLLRAGGQPQHGRTGGGGSP